MALTALRSPFVARTWILLSALALPSCADPDPVVLPPLGEVVVSVDTDAPVPELIGRLRIDVFAADGHWLDSRDVLRGDPRDWPASFSVYTDGDLEKTLILRLRGYTEGRLRRYEGERLYGQQPFVEPHTAQSLAELCEEPPELRLGEPLTLRWGRQPITGFVATDECSRSAAHGGAVAAKLVIEQAGNYRIETTRVVPYSSTAGDTLLVLRKTCNEPLSQLACNDEASGDLSLENYDHLSRILTSLQPGTYSVVAMGLFASPAEVTLKADRVDAWQDDPRAVEAAPPALPRLVVNGVDITPEQEPQPLVTIDRLTRLHVTPGKKQLARITLHAQCAGTMPRLSAAGSFAELVPEEAETCLDQERQRSALADEPLEPYVTLPARSSVGRFALVEPCERTDAGATAACIPSGQFVLGLPDVESTVGRFAVMHRFWIDRTEATVERWRDAVRRGFVAPDGSPRLNNQRLYARDGDPVWTNCTYSESRLPGADDRERYPLNCVTWYDARAFCQFEGGDLPSEAQWEYVASRAGRERSGQFPWAAQDGSAVSCDQAVFSRAHIDTTTDCSARGLSVASVDDPSNQNDVTALGVQAMAGNVREWVLDAWAETLERDCWQSATIVDPLCWETEALKRSVRGGSIGDPASDLFVGTRRSLEPLGSAITGQFWLGFRCAYKERK